MPETILRLFVKKMLLILCREATEIDNADVV